MGSWVGGEWGVWQDRTVLANSPAAQLNPATGAPTGVMFDGQDSHHRHNWWADIKTNWAMAH